MNTWGILNRTNNMTRRFFSSFLYTCIVFTFFLNFKENTIATTNKRRAKQIQQKEIYRNVEDKLLPIVFDYVLPKRQCSTFSFLFFFSLVLKLYPYLFPFSIKGRELISHISFTPLFFSSFTEEQKSLLFVFNMDMQILNKYVFRRN